MFFSLLKFILLMACFMAIILFIAGYFALQHWDHCRIQYTVIQCIDSMNPVN